MLTVPAVEPLDKRSTLSLSPDCNVYALDVKVGVATGCNKGAYVEDTSPDVTNVPDEEGNVKVAEPETTLEGRVTVPVSVGDAEGALALS
jgi:hypothetical protein